MTLSGNFDHYGDVWCKPTGSRFIDVARVQTLAEPPITLAEAKIKLRVDFTDDDAEITALIKVAIRLVENFCNISITYQRILCIVRSDEEFRLPYGPVIGIESVADSNANTGSGPVNYVTSTNDWQSDGDLFYPAGDYRMRIQYTAGNFLPDDLKDAVLQVLVFLYENRGKDKSVADIEAVLSNAINYRVPWI